MNPHSPAPLRPSVTGRAETPMAFVQSIAQAYTQREMDPLPALTEAQIAPETLHHPNARITALQMEWLSATAMQALDDEALGWFSRRLPWGSYGMLVRASLTAPSLGVALQRWCRHHGLLHGALLLLDALGKLGGLTARRGGGGGRDRLMARPRAQGKGGEGSDREKNRAGQ